MSECEVECVAECVPGDRVLDWENLLECYVGEKVFAQLSFATLCKLRSACRSWSKIVGESTRYRSLSTRRPCYFVKQYSTWSSEGCLTIEIAIHNPLRMEWFPTRKGWVTEEGLKARGIYPGGGENGLLCFLRYNSGLVLLVYNPLTHGRRELRPIPDSGAWFSVVLKMVPREQSYQIVVIRRRFTVENRPQLYIYDSVTDAWTSSVQKPKSGLEERDIEVLLVGPFLNGCVYYVLRHGRQPAEKCSIWSYKIETDEWTNLCVPASILQSCINFSVVECGGKLILVVTGGSTEYSDEESNDEFDEGSENVYFPPYVAPDEDPGEETESVEYSDEDSIDGDERPEFINGFVFEAPEEPFEEMQLRGEFLDVIQQRGEFLDYSDEDSNDSDDVGSGSHGYESPKYTREVKHVDVWELQPCQQGDLKFKSTTSGAAAQSCYTQDSATVKADETFVKGEPEGSCWVHLSRMPDSFFHFLKASLKREPWPCGHSRHSQMFELQSTTVLAAEQCLYFCFDQFYYCDRVLIFDCLERSWSWLDPSPDERARPDSLPVVKICTYRPNRALVP